MSDVQLKPSLDLKPAIEAEIVISKQVAANARALVIHNQDNMIQAEKDLVEIKKRFKALDEKRKEIQKPFKDAVANLKKGQQGIEDLFAPPLAYWSEAEQTTKQACLTYDRLVAQQKAEAAAKAQEAFARGDTAAIREHVIASAMPTEHVKGVSILQNWQAEVTDLKALVLAWLDGKVPVDAITHNQSVLTTYAKVYKKDAQMPGVTFTDVGTVRGPRS